MAETAALLDLERWVEAFRSQAGALDLERLASMVRAAAADGSNADLIAQRCNLSINFVLEALGQRSGETRSGHADWLIEVEPGPMATQRYPDDPGESAEHDQD